MFISQFNRFLDRHGRLAIIVIAVVMIIPFLFLWGPSSRLFRGKSPRKNEIGKVMGNPVSVQDFLRQVLALDLQFMRYMPQRDRWPHQVEYFQDEIISQAITRLRLLHEARRRNLTAVNEDEIYDRIFELFSSEGQFQDNSYESFLHQARRSLGLNENDLMMTMRDEIIISRLRDYVNAGVFVAALEAKQEAARLYQSFDVAVSRFTAEDYMDETELTPTKSEVESYYTTHKDEIKAPVKKRVRVAVIPFADDKGQIEVTEAEIEELMGKVDPDASEAELEAARQSIRRKLRTQKQQSEALKKAREIVAGLITEYETAESDSEVNAAAALQKLANPLGVETIDSGPFTKWSPIPNVGRNEELQNKAYELSNDNQLSSLVMAEDRIYLAAWLETLPAEPASELTPVLAEKLKEDLVTDKLRRFYEKKVEPFRDFAEAGVTPVQMTAALRANSLDALPESPILTELSRSELMDAVQNYYSRYYLPPTKKVVVAPFEFSAFKDEVGALSEDELRQYYQDNKADYKIEKDNEKDSESEKEVTYKSFDEARDDVRQALERQRAKELAFAAADRFAYDAYMRVADLESVQDAAALFRKLADEGGWGTMTSEWFSQNERVAVFNYNPSVAREAYEVSPNKAVSNALEGRDAYFVVCWRGNRPGRLPAFADEALSRGTLKEQVIRQKAVEIARAKAEAAYTTLSDSLEAGDTTFEEARSTWDFKDIPEFTRANPPQTEQSAQIIGAVTDMAPQNLSKPVEIENGAFLVYFKSQKTPSEEELADRSEQVRERLRWRKQNAEMQSLIEDLQDADEGGVNADLAEQLLSY